MSRDPKPFRGGARDPAGGLWVIPAVGEDADEMHWRVNPRIACPPGAFHAVRLWDRSRGGMAPGPLPEAGGVNDQPAWLMAAFGVLAGVDDASQAGKGGD